MNKLLAVAGFCASSFFGFFTAIETAVAGISPVKLQVSPGQQQAVSLSRLHLNRIVTPFSAPQVRTIDQAEIRIEGSVIYLSSQKEEPFVVYVTEHNNEKLALPLLVTLLDIPPKEVQLTLSKQWQRRISAHKETAKIWEEANDYEQTITEVLTLLVKGRIPEGYELMPFYQPDFQPCIQEGVTFDFTKAQQVQGHHFKIIVGKANNTTEKILTFQESQCHSSEIRAVSLWPDNTLHPGQNSELFLVFHAPDLTVSPVIRPSLLTH